MAVPAVGLLLAAKMASNMAPISSGDCWFWRDIKRAMWRWVTWVNSCASTEANSWRLATVAISPKCTPKYPPGRAKAFTLGSRIRLTSQAKRCCNSADNSPRSRAACIKRNQICCTCSASTGSSR